MTSADDSRARAGEALAPQQAEQVVERRRTQVGDTVSWRAVAIGWVAGSAGLEVAVGPLVRASDLR